jgi:predicted dithiol-disulfide oxidoreductase (DUF899 family)
MARHDIVSRDQWSEARRALLVEEKAWTRERDRLSEKRRALPWVKVEKTYVFQGADGPVTLGELFDGRSQLIVYHFMFGPDWEAGCKSCTFWADNLERSVVHLHHRDTNLVLVSRGPIEMLLAYRKRMGWTMEWVSALNNSFNQDFAVSFTKDEAAKKTYNFGTIAPESEEMPGISVFAKDGDAIYHTYSTYARGIDMVNGTYQLLDLVPKGRDEDGLEDPMDWVRRRDEYRN